MVLSTNNNQINIEIDKSKIKVEDFLDEGGEGEVFRGEYDNKKVIIKKYKSLDDDYQVEVNAYNLLFHTYMVACHGYFMDDEGYYNLVLEEALGTLLSDIAGSEEGEELYVDYYERLCIAYQICEFLEYLRKNHVIHRDLKTDNIMVEIKKNENRYSKDDSNSKSNSKYSLNELKNIVPIKLLDFGITKIAEKTYTTTYSQGHNTVNYSSPELYDTENLDDLNTKLISYKVDIWAFGCIVSYLFSGIIPWENLARNRFVIQSKITNGSKFPIPKEVDERVIPLIELCTNLNPKERPNPSTLLRLIEKLYEDKKIEEDIKNLSNKDYI